MKKNTKMDAKLLVCDLDGTLLDAQGKIDQESLKMIKKFCEDGGHFVVCTGRMDTDIKYVEDQLGFISDFRISQNGAVIYDSQDNLILCETIPEKYLIDLNEIIFGMNLRTEVSNLKNRFFPSPRHPDDVAEFVDSSIVIEDLPHHIGKIEKEPTIYLTFGSQEKFDEIRQKIEKRMGKEKVSIVMTSPQSLEIFSNKASKGKALEQVMRMLEITAEHTFAAGDAESDITMYPIAGHAYAVQEAPVMVREAADAYVATVGDIVKSIYEEA